MTKIKAFRLASLVTAINVLVASGFSIAAIIRPQYLVPAESVPTEASLLLAMYAARPRIPLALLVLGAIYKQATPALLILAAPLPLPCNCWMPESVCLLHDLGKCWAASLSPSSKSSWCICFTDPCGSRRKPSPDKRNIVVDGIGGEVLSAALKALALGGSLTTLGYSASRKATIDVTELLNRLSKEVVR